MTKDISKEKFNAILFLMGQRAVQEGKTEEYKNFCKELIQRGGRNEDIHTVHSESSIETRKTCMGM